MALLLCGPVPEAGSSLVFGQLGGQRSSFLGFGQANEQQSPEKVYSDIFNSCLLSTFICSSALN